jgi:hypothetical protein
VPAQEPEDPADGGAGGLGVVDRVEGVVGVGEVDQLDRQTTGPGGGHELVDGVVQLPAIPARLSAASSRPQPVYWPSP